MKISVCKDEWRDAYQRALDLNFENVKTLDAVPWNQLRVVLRNMQTKYQKDPNRFHKFMDSPQQCGKRKGNETAHSLYLDTLRIGGLGGLVDSFIG